MIVILKPNATKEKRDQLIQKIQSLGLSVHLSEGEHTTLLGLIGDTSAIDPAKLESVEIVDAVRRVSEPYKLCNRQFHQEDTVVNAGGVPIGGGYFTVIAGPCSVESEQQILYTAERVQAAGARLLRGGAFKPRTSPYAFRGLKAEGIELLLEAKKKTGLPIVTELTSLEHLDLFNDVDVIQVGARNMQNFDMLWELGKCKKPVLLKRGLSSTIREWLMSAEYICAGGNPNVILCERGIRTFETETRNTLDLSAVPVLKKKTHLPVLVDPSHATGHADLIIPLAKAAVAAGADGLMIEVHPDPVNALCDGAQSITPDTFDKLMQQVRAYCALENKVCE
ncbi:MAG: 3-deoxy-7-phosphoheptulonate synthase [Clostridia bacterium]|nr:3-deoxy-7-phosphoheptulonate synthase [Clostridia bacterium]